MYTTTQSAGIAANRILSYAKTEGYPTHRKHAVPYAVPVFRALAQHPQLDFHVALLQSPGSRTGI